MLVYNSRKNVFVQMNTCRKDSVSRHWLFATSLADSGERPWTYDS